MKNRQFVPALSSSVKGSLGVSHLPRLHSKIELEGYSILHDDYPAVGDGFDKMVIEGLGLDKEKVVEAIQGNGMLYSEFEEWVREQPGVKLDPENIAALNTSIAGYKHSAETREGILKFAGVTVDEEAPWDAVSLNDIEDEAIRKTMRAEAAAVDTAEQAASTDSAEVTKEPEVSENKAEPALAGGS